MKYQELKVRHSDLLKSHKALEEQFEEQKSMNIGNLSSSPKENNETDKIIGGNFKVNESFDFSPYNFKRTITVGKPPAGAHFAMTERGMHTSKTMAELNLADSLKEVQLEDLSGCLSKKDSNAEIFEKESVNNNTSLLTNSDISKAKPEILERLREERPPHLDLVALTNNPPLTDADNEKVQYLEDLRSNVVAIKYESYLREDAMKTVQIKTPEQREESKPTAVNPNLNLRRKSSFIEFTPLPSSFMGKKKESAGRKPSRKPSDHMEKMQELIEAKEGRDVSGDEIIELRKKTPLLEKKMSLYSRPTKKKLFEEFLLIGIEKQEFQKLDSQTQAQKGYLTPSLMFEYPKSEDLTDPAK